MELVGRTVILRPSGRSAAVTSLLGEGGQGTVYEVRTEAGERLALKWYHPHTATAAQRSMITDLVERGMPHERFLWPSEMASLDDGSGLGYVMPLRPPQFVGLAALLNGVVDTSLRSVCTIGFQLADSFVKLHMQGLCYRDISFGNVFFDPATGDALICDNDNVGVDGETQSAVIGTKRFMAPEIVRGAAKPSAATDLYSLSVLLFYLLMVGHPLLGAAELRHPVWNEVAERQLFGERPVFVFDPRVESNRPVAGMHDAVVANWRIYPTSLRTMFEQAFTVGLHEPERRIRDSQWRSELVRCRDLLRPCNRCGAANFFDRDVEAQRCWNCSSELPGPLGLVFDQRTVVLNEATQITAHHLGRRDYDFDRVEATVARHPRQPDLWGLRNDGPGDWRARLPDGEVRTVEPGRSIGLVEGMQVRFGDVVARLQRLG